MKRTRLWPHFVSLGFAPLGAFPSTILRRATNWSAKSGANALQKQRTGAHEYTEEGYTVEVYNSSELKDIPYHNTNVTLWKKRP